MFQNSLHPDVLLAEHHRHVDERLTHAAQVDAARRRMRRQRTTPPHLGGRRLLPVLRFGRRRRRHAPARQGVAPEVPDSPTAGCVEAPTIDTCPCSANQAA